MDAPKRKNPYNPDDYLSPSSPRFGNALTRWIGRMIMRAMGYTFSGRLPDEPKLVIAAAPHTSNWDLLLAIGTILSLGVRINFMMKKEAFVFPFKNLFIALGGIPLDRANPKSVVKQTIKQLEDNEQMYLAILPEGTRKSVDRWKPGFLRIARTADVPVFLFGLDGENKILYFDKLVYPEHNTADSPSGAAVRQTEEIRQYMMSTYSGIKPQNQAVTDNGPDNA